MWRLSRHAVTTAAVRAAACVSVALIVSDATGAEEVTARILEVGDRGRIAVGEPATVRVEIATEARLPGTFRARLARPREARPDWEMFGTPSAGVRFLLEAGETRVLNAYLPDVPEGSCSGARLQWSVDNEDGRRVAEGVQPLVCLPLQPSSVRVLYLTDEELPLRRALADAYDEAQSYSGTSVCLVSGRDFVRLREEQKEALLDWAALGSVLVLAAPLAPPGHGIDDRLAARQALLWRDAGGREIREARLHLGFVRTIDLPLASVAATPVSSALFRLVTSDGPVAPGIDDRAFRRQPVGNPWDDLRAHEEPARIGRAVGAVALLILLIAAAGVRWSSRPRVAAPAAAIAGLAALLAIAPAVVYVAASAVPTGNGDDCWDLVLHDAAGGLQSRWTMASLGGGGGRVDPVLSFAADPRVAWRAQRYAGQDDSVRTELDTDGKVRVGVERRALSYDRLLFVRRAEAGPNDPAWDVEIVPQGDGVAGSLRARRAFTRVGVVGPRGAAWLGSVRQGERIDLARVSWPRDPYFPRGTDRLERVARDLLVGRFFDGRVLVSAALLYAIATEAAPCSVAVSTGGVPGPPCTVHVQPLLTEAPDEPAGWLPAERRAEKLHVHAPAALWDRLSAEGRLLRPEVSYLDDAAPAVSPTVVDGFREVVFRIGGAPTANLPGARGTVLGRWRARTSPRGQP